MRSVSSVSRSSLVKTSSMPTSKAPESAYSLSCQGIGLVVIHWNSRETRYHGGGKGQRRIIGIEKGYRGNANVNRSGGMAMVGHDETGTGRGQKLAEAISIVAVQQRTLIAEHDDATNLV